MVVLIYTVKYQMQRKTVLLSLSLILWLLCAITDAINPLKLMMPGKVAEPHAKYEEACKQCHEAWQGVDSTRCLKCHDILAKAIQTGKGLHRGPVDTVEGQPFYEWQGIALAPGGPPNRGTCAACHPDHK